MTQGHEKLLPIIKLSESNKCHKDSKVDGWLYCMSTFVELFNVKLSFSFPFFLTRN